MARHRLIRNLDLSEELDDYDGYDEYDDYDDYDDVKPIVAPEKKTVKRLPAIKSIQGEPEHFSSHQAASTSFPLPFFGCPYVDRSKPASILRTYQTVVDSPRLVENFFHDTPWLNIPSHRRGEILIDPLYPKGKLLGGASKQPSDGKISKLAALAAARRRKEEEKKKAVSREMTEASQKDSNALVDPALRVEGLHVSENPRKQGLDALASNNTTSFSQRPGRRLKNLRTEMSQPPPEPEAEADGTAHKFEEKEESSNEAPISQQLQAAPSSFAMTALGTRSSPFASQSRGGSFTMQYAPSRSITEPFTFLGPSPDDVVKAAKNSTAKKAISASSKPVGRNDTIAPVTTGLRDLAVPQSSAPKYKGIDVLAQYKKSNMKRSANFVVIGHVDAGKSTLMGRLLLDLGVVDQRTIEKYRKQAQEIGKSSFALAWVLDQGSEERNRGVTIDIATNKFETENAIFTILDAPGHQDFIPNMIAGASQADFAVLVIDGSPNSFESGLRGQTKEHVLLVRSIGVKRLIVAINKLDTVNWSKARFEEITTQMSAFLTPAGFVPKNVTFIPCSGLFGDNITRQSMHEAAAWYKGPTLIQELEKSEPVMKDMKKPFRVTIVDVFRGGITNPLSISGRLSVGTLQVGDNVMAMPSGEVADIREIDVDGASADWAVAGQNVILHLQNIDPVFLKSGDVLCDPRAPIGTVSSFTAKILAFEHVTPMQINVHRGRLDKPGRIVQLIATLDKGSGAVVKKKPRIIQPGNLARVWVELDSPVPLEAPDQVILRAEGTTVAAGLLE